MNNRPHTGNLLRLLIVSHTEHYIKGDQVVGWGATVREINFLSPFFAEIIHVAPLYRDGEVPPSSLPYSCGNIRFVPLVPSGGESWYDKFSVLTTMFPNLKVIRKAMEGADLFQFRAPTGLGVYVIPYLLFKRKPGWFKYAGNWKQPNPPLSYWFQKWMLTHQRIYPVTINGHWDDQPSQCLSFENPCLTMEERLEGEKISREKDFTGKLNFCFVGRLDESKGVDRIIDAFRMITDFSRIGQLHFIGDGPKRLFYESQCAGFADSVVFHGFLPRNRVAQIMAQSHFLLLPSDSEGFPKVIAEAANYGCIPISSDVSCIADYIEDGINGFLFPKGPIHSELVYDTVMMMFHYVNLDAIAISAHTMAESFTFDHYASRITKEIIPAEALHQSSNLSISKCQL